MFDSPFCELFCAPTPWRGAARAPFAVATMGGSMKRWRSAQAVAARGGAVLAKAKSLQTPSLLPRTGPSIAQRPKQARPCPCNKDLRAGRRRWADHFDIGANRHLWDSSPRGGTPSAWQADASTTRQQCLWCQAFLARQGVLSGISRKRSIRSSLYWSTEFCNSQCLSHFAAPFIVVRAETSVAESCKTI